MPSLLGVLFMKKLLQDQKAIVSSLVGFHLGLVSYPSSEIFRALVWLGLPGNHFMRTLSHLSMTPLVLPKLNTAIGSTGRHLQPGTRQHIYGKFCSKVLKNIRSLSKVVIVVQPSAALAQLAKFAR